MKKRYILPIVPVLFTVASIVYPVGWPMPSNTMQTIAQVVFWVSLSAIPVISLFAFWDKISKAIPIKVKIEKRFESSLTLLTEEEQEGHEEQWLRPVIEWIDFKRDWLSANQIMLKYQIDSGLVYDFKPYRMWIKLRIGQYEPKDGWEILQTPNLLKGKRSQFACETFTVNDDNLLKIIQGCREGLKIAQTLKIIMQLRDGDSLRVLESSYSINPYSEFVQEKVNDAG